MTRPDETAIIQTNDENVVMRHCRIKAVRLKSETLRVWVLR